MDTTEPTPAGNGGAPFPLALRRVAIDTYRENVAYLHRDCEVYRAEGFQALAKVEVRANGRCILATLNVTTDPRIVRCNELGLSEDAFAQLGAQGGVPVLVSQAEPPSSIPALHRKIAGERLTRDDFHAIVRDIAGHRYSKIELTAFVVASNQGELDREEVFFLTEAMSSVGSRLDWRERPVVDKHCIGGIPGNRTSMLVVPIVAAHGMLCPKTSSRAITSPAGTADTMEVLAGVELPMDKLADAVDRLTRADGRLHPVEEDRRRLHPSGARHPPGTERQGALDARGAAAAQAVRVRRRPHEPVDRRGDHRRPPADRLRHRPGAGGA
jgi:thymidine phosphorylase